MNEYIQLDKLTLQEHTNKSGGILNLDELEESRQMAKQNGCFFEAKTMGN